MRTNGSLKRIKAGHKVRVKKLKKANPNFFKETGSLGGINSPTRFTSETGRANANKRWERYREEQLKKGESI